MKRPKSPVSSNFYKEKQFYISFWPYCHPPEERIYNEISLYLFSSEYNTLSVEVWTVLRFVPSLLIQNKRCSSFSPLGNLREVRIIQITVRVTFTKMKQGWGIRVKSNQKYFAFIDLLLCRQIEYKMRKSMRTSHVWV